MPFGEGGVAGDVPFGEGGVAGDVPFGEGGVAEGGDSGTTKQSLSLLSAISHQPSKLILPSNLSSLTSLRLSD